MRSTSVYGRWTFEKILIKPQFSGVYETNANGKMYKLLWSHRINWLMCNVYTNPHQAISSSLFFFFFARIKFCYLKFYQTKKRQNILRINSSTTTWQYHDPFKNSNYFYLLDFTEKIITLRLTVEIHSVRNETNFCFV